MNEHDQETVAKLRDIAFQVRGLGYLVGLQRQDDAPPEDVDDLYWGVGQVIDQLGRQIRELTNKLELGSE